MSCSFYCTLLTQRITFFCVKIEQKKYQPSDAKVERHYRQYKEEDLSKILEGFPLCAHCGQSQSSWELQSGPLHCLLTWSMGSIAIDRQSQVATWLYHDFKPERQVRCPTLATCCICPSVTDLKLIENSSIPLWLTLPKMRGRLNWKTKSGVCQHFLKGSFLTPQNPLTVF